MPRYGQSDQAQVNIEMGQGTFDLDHEVMGLQGQVGRLKQMATSISEESRLQGQAAESLVNVLVTQTTCVWR